MSIASYPTRRRKGEKADLFRRPAEPEQIERVSRIIEVANMALVRASVIQPAYLRATNGTRKVVLSLPRVRCLETDNG
jgi:hypothetical protein